MYDMLTLNIRVHCSCGVISVSLSLTCTSADTFRLYTAKVTEVGELGEVKESLEADLEQASK